MKIIFSILLLALSFSLAFAGDTDFVSNNSLVATYYTNAKNNLNTKPEECVFWADKAIAESKISGNKLDLGRSLFIKGQALEKLNNNEASVLFIHESLKVAQYNKFFDLEIDALNKLSTLYAKSGDYKSAVHYASLLHDKKDSSVISHQKILAKTLPGKLELQQRELKMKQLLVDNSFLDDHLRTNLKTIDSQGNWILLIVIGYSLIFLFFIVIKRQNKLILKKNQILIQQMNILEVGKMELNHNLYKAEESERLKTAFLSNISHEIRTPLNAIVGFSGFLRQKDKPGSERKKYVEVIHHYSESLLSLINEIFDIARIESGEIKQDPEKLGVNDFLRKVHSTYCENNKKTIKKGHQLVLNLQPPDPVCYITTYPERFQSVLHHLIDNALKNTENGKVELGYVTKDAFIEFYVLEDGHSLPKVETNDIFERFKANQDFPKPGSGSLGLGLTISKNFIESMGGRIWIKNNIDKGSTIFFTLPVEQDLKS